MVSIYAPYVVAAMMGAAPQDTAPATMDGRTAFASRYEWAVRVSERAWEQLQLMVRVQDEMAAEEAFKAYRARVERALREQQEWLVKEMEVAELEAMPEVDPSFGIEHLSSQERMRVESLRAERSGSELMSIWSSPEMSLRRAEFTAALQRAVSSQEQGARRALSRGVAVVCEAQEDGLADRIEARLAVIGGNEPAAFRMGLSEGLPLGRDLYDLLLSPNLFKGGEPAATAVWVRDVIGLGGGGRETLSLEQRLLQEYDQVLARRLDDYSVMVGETNLSHARAAARGEGWSRAAKGLLDAQVRSIIDATLTYGESFANLVDKAWGEEKGREWRARLRAELFPGCPVETRATRVASVVQQELATSDPRQGRAGSFLARRQEAIAGLCRVMLEATTAGGPVDTPAADDAKARLLADDLAFEEEMKRASAPSDYERWMKRAGSE